MTSTGRLAPEGASRHLGTWVPRPSPGLVPLDGDRVRLEPFDAPLHLAALFAAVGGSENADLWQWMPSGPFFQPELLREALDRVRRNDGWRTMVIRHSASGNTLGMASYMRQREAHGSVEVGCVVFGARLRRTTEATEALALMARHVFDELGYRRYEWKCDALNQASRRAAERFGFTFEGVFRNDMVTKGRNRDTAWYSITDAEWPARRVALERFLDAGNFDAAGRQIRRLEAFR